MPEAALTSFTLFGEHCSVVAYAVHSN